METLTNNKISCAIGWTGKGNTIMTNELNVVIGSWGSYNACNDRAQGSKWINLADYTDWDEITVELKSQGFMLKGIDEELFIQDIEGLPSGCTNWDYMHPKTLFDTLYRSGVLEDNHKYDIMIAFLEVRSYDEFEELVSSKGYHWDDDIRLYSNYDWEDYGREMFDCYGYNVDERLLNFFDFEAYGQYIGSDFAQEYDGGIIEILT